MSDRRFRFNIVSIAGTLALLLASAVARADPSDSYLKPALTVNENLASIFSKTVSISGSGFDEYTKRVAGSANNTVVKVTPEAIDFRGDYRYDGYSSGSGDYKILRDGITNCINGKCTVNDETSGVLFNPLLWGVIPKDLTVGTRWTAHIARSWEIGPPGTERVQVMRLDPSNGVIVLAREGSGTGPSSDDEALKASGKSLTITRGGKEIAVSVIPGETHWTGYTTVCRGVIVSDVIIVQRHVTMVSKTGDTFQGEQRSYTLFNYIQGTV